jgi:predicted nucleic acid-binding protein
VRFVLDTNMLIGYLRERPLTADAIFAAASKGTVFISVVSVMELSIFNEEGKANQKSNQQIREELNKIDQLCMRLGIKKVTLSSRAQEYALAILDEPRSRSLLGKNALTDSLIIGTGIVKRAHLVTRDRNWFDLAQQMPNRVRAMSPEQLVAEL